MTFRSHMLRYRIDLVLAASLLLLGWFHLHHELTAHLAHPDESCMVCVFTGHLGDGAVPSMPATPAVGLTFRLDITPRYVAPALEQPFRVALSERGPPSLSSLI